MLTANATVQVIETGEETEIGTVTVIVIVTEKEMTATATGETETVTAIVMVAADEVVTVTAEMIAATLEIATVTMTAEEVTVTAEMIARKEIGLVPVIEIRTVTAEAAEEEAERPSRMNCGQREGKDGATEMARPRPRPMTRRRNANLSGARRTRMCRIGSAMSS